MPGGDRQTGGLPPGFNKFTAFTTATMPGDTIFFACRLSDPAKEKSFKQKIAGYKDKGIKNDKDRVLTPDEQIMKEEMLFF